MNFNQTHFRIGINNAAVGILTPNKKEIELFKKEPKYAHLNLHAVALNDQNQFVWPHVKDKQEVKFYKNYRWDLLSLALFAKNADVFNSLVRDTKPLTSMMFKVEKKSIAGKNKNEYSSYCVSLYGAHPYVKFFWHYTQISPLRKQGKRIRVPFSCQGYLSFYTSRTL